MTTAQNNSFASFVAILSKPGADILASLTPAKCELWHGATGVSTEAGELLEGVQTYLIFDENRFDDEAYPDAAAAEEAIMLNIVEELGDTLFYTMMIRNNLMASDDITPDTYAYLDTRFQTNEIPQVDPEIVFNDAILYYAVDLVISANILLDLVKKVVIYNKGVEIAAIAKALTDVEELVVHLSDVIDVPIAEIEEAVRAKLAVRYESLTYSDNAANARADKAA